VALDSIEKMLEHRTDKSSVGSPVQSTQDLVQLQEPLHREVSRVRTMTFLINENVFLFRHRVGGGGGSRMSDFYKCGIIVS